MPTKIEFKGQLFDGVIWMLDAGHGVETKGKESPIWEDGSQLLEYEYNRKILKLLTDKYKEFGNAWFQPHVITVGDHDWPLTIRTKRANRFATRYPDYLCIYLSIHGDAFRAESVHGTTLYTSPGHTDADDLARVLLDGMYASTSKRKQRFVRTQCPVTNEFNLFKPHTWKFRGLKEEKFTVLTKTLMPAILLETGFYTNRIECKYMMSAKGQQQIADTIFDGMLNVYNELKVDTNGSI